MIRRARYRPAALSLLLAFWLAPLAAAAQPNILLLCVDDLGWAGADYQGDRYDTPNIDRLAAGGDAFQPRLHRHPDLQPREGKRIRPAPTPPSSKNPKPC